MRIIPAILASLIALPGLAEGPGGNCIGAPLDCVTQVLGQPTEVQGYDLVMEYQELAAKYGKYFYNAPQGNTRYSGTFTVKDDVPTTFFFRNPLVRPAQGKPFRLPCEYTVMLSTQKQTVANIGHNCSCAPFGTRLRLTDIAQGMIPQACKEPV